MNEQSGHKTETSRSDSPPQHWLIDSLPPLVRPYALLMRLDRPIGTWLLLFPCWWSLALASERLPNLWYTLLFAVGAIVMRGAGCVLNDLYDRHLDAQVARTRDRPLASGAVKPWQAIVFLGCLLLIGLGVLWMFNPLTEGLGIASLLLVAIYPLMKRYTWWPQLFLGFTFNWGALLGWTAVRGSLGVGPVMLYTAGIFWTLAYDTIYAHQDKEDDISVNIKSTALLFGKASRKIVAGFYALTLLVLFVTGWVEGLGQIFDASLLAAFGLVVWHMTLWDSEDPANCLRRFKANRDIGLIILVGIIAGKMF